MSDNQGTAHNKTRASQPLPPVDEGQSVETRNTVAELSRDELLAEAIRSHLRWIEGQRARSVEAATSTMNPQPQAEDPWKAQEATYRVILAELIGRTPDVLLR